MDRHGKNGEEAGHTNRRHDTAKHKTVLLNNIGASLVQQFLKHPNLEPCPCGVPLAEHFRRKPPGTSSGDERGSTSSDSSRTLVDRTLDSEASSDNSRPCSVRATKSDHSKHAGVVTLDDLSTMEAVERLAAHHGRVSHMGMLDRSYSFFVNTARTGALSFKVQNQVAIVGGDPLCEPNQLAELLAGFEEYRKRFHWGIAFLGASEAFAEYARRRSWATLQFGTERVLNPMTCDVLMERSGKRMIVQNKQLLHPAKGGITLEVYLPACGKDLSLQRELVAVYDAWRHAKAQSATASQAFVTVYDPFSLPRLMTYIYTRGRDGRANGFAALRKMGPDQCYHIDPCVAAPGAPKGISDLLMFAAMAFLNHADVAYLSLGYEPLDELGKITGMSRTMEKLTRVTYRHAFRRLPLGGKRAYHDKLKPDPEKSSTLYIIFPSGSPGPREIFAMAHMANISIRNLFRTKRSSPSKTSQSASDATQARPSGLTQRLSEQDP